MNETKREKELITIILRLCYRLPSDDPVREEAIDYLERTEQMPQPIYAIAAE